MVTAIVAAVQEEAIYSTVDEIVDDGVMNIDYAVIEGFSPGKKVRIGSVSALDIIEWSEANEDPRKKRFAGLRLICKSLVDKAGVRYAMQDEMGNIGKFQRMRHGVTERIVREILKLNQMNVKQDAEAKKD